MRTVPLCWRRGRRLDPELLHAVPINAPVKRLPNGALVRFALCGRATELRPPAGRSWLHCPQCLDRMNPTANRQGSPCSSTSPA